MNQETNQPSHRGRLSSPREVGPRADIGRLVSSPSAGVFVLGVIDIDGRDGSRRIQVWDWETEQLLWQRHDIHLHNLTPDGGGIICTIPKRRGKRPKFVFDTLGPRYKKSRLQTVICDARTGRVVTHLDCEPQSTCYDIFGCSQQIIDEVSEAYRGLIGRREYAATSTHLRLLPDWETIYGCSQDGSKVACLRSDPDSIETSMVPQSENYLIEHTAPTKWIVDVWDTQTWQLLSSFGDFKRSCFFPDCVFSWDGSRVYMGDVYPPREEDGLEVPWVYRVRVGDCITGEAEQIIETIGPLQGEGVFIRLAPDETKLALLPRGYGLSSTQVQMWPLK